MPDVGKTSRTHRCRADGFCVLPEGHTSQHSAATPEQRARGTMAWPVLEAHETLGALLHCSVEHDEQSSPDGYRRARELGLVEGVNPVPTEIGRGVLRALGAA